MVHTVVSQFPTPITSDLTVRYYHNLRDNLDNMNEGVFIITETSIIHIEYHPYNGHINTSIKKRQNPRK